MKSIFVSFMILLSIVLLLPGTVIGKTEPPMKVMTNVIIPDGEFLHYGLYNGQDKTMDYYYTTKIVTNNKSGFYYKIYFDIIPVKGKHKLAARYTDWPITMLVDSVSAQVIETEGTLDTNCLKDFESLGVGDIVYWHSQFVKEESLFKYMSRSYKDGNSSTRSYRIKVNTAYPLMDMFSQDFISERLVDPTSKGIMYWVIPDFMKEPMAMTFKTDHKIQTITSKAGTFRVYKIVMYVGDRFLAKLAESMLKNNVCFVEESPRHLMIKTSAMGSDEILEEVSVVK